VPFRIELAEKEGTSLLFASLADGAGGPAERVEGTEEPAVLLMPPTHVAAASPPAGAERVEAPVIADPGEGVLLDGVVGDLGQPRPGLQAIGPRRRDPPEGGPA